MKTFDATIAKPQLTIHKPLAHIMKGHLNYFPLLLIMTLFLVNGCKKKSESENKLIENETKFKYSKAIIQYDLGNNTRQDIVSYISNNDTIGFQEITYVNNVIDSTRSRFYRLELFRDNKTNLFGGKLNYYFDSIKDGKVESFRFSAISKHNDSTDIVEFKNYDIKKNLLEFNFEHDNDTLMGFIYAQHTKDIIENGEEKVRIREILIAVDNYNETNNPFVEIKL